mmetsp:Transcript_14052/g.23869  ORF Transcript_14052/g.23869 Transcript_14052/m.23869 type:complete len:146 (+) Transcript_14052:142-579(+)
MAYNKCHIRGAQFLDLATFSDMKTDLPFMMPSEADFTARMKQLGVKMSDKVVCYETGEKNLFSYRAAWMLQAMGHPNVHVLDGALHQWVNEGRPVASCKLDTNPKDFGYKMQRDKITFFNQIKYPTQPHLIIDNRPAQYYQSANI